MKFGTKLITIALVLASTTLAAGTGACNAGACGYCDKIGEDKFCTNCWNSPMSGTGIDRKCSGGTAIKGCLHYKTTDDTSSGKIYCAKCNEAKRFYLKEGATPDANICVECDLTKNYVATDKTCKPATVVEGCTSYKKYSDSCATCESGKQLFKDKCDVEIPNCIEPSTFTNTRHCEECAPGYHVNGTGEDTGSNSNLCTPNISNCEEARSGTKADSKCKDCEKGYTVDNSDDTCQAITVPNCDESSNNDPSKCTKCVTGYLLANETTCSKIEVSNCASTDSTDVKKCKNCLSGFFRKSDGTACTAMASCAAAIYKDALQCYQCKTENPAGSKYYATDVKGTAKISVEGGDKWEQVCTKAASILASVVTAIAIFSGF